MDQIKLKLEGFNKDLMKIPGVEDLVKATNIPASFFALGVITFSVVLVAFNFCGCMIVQLISVAYPAAKSAMAIETESKDDDKQWLTYWMVFGLFNILDQTFGYFLEMIPFYFLIKLLILIWLQNPISQGALIIYNSAIQPFAQKYKAEVDQVANGFNEMFIQVGNMAG